MHRPERTDQRVLGDLLGIAPIAQQAKRDGIQPILVIGDEGRERRVDVPREAGC